MIEKRVERRAYVRVPMDQNPSLKQKIIDSKAVRERLKEIEEARTEIAKRRSNPTWVPSAGWIGFRCWTDYHSKSTLPYPGGSLAQPSWWEEDRFGFDDLENWCYLKHEMQVLSEAIGLQKRDDVNG